MRRNLRKQWNILKELWLPFTKYSITTYASSTCYYILLSLLPGIALGLTVLSTFPSIAKNWIFQLNGIFPVSFQPITEYLITIIRPKRPAALVSLWVVVALWSSSKGIMAMTDGMTAILQCKNYHGFFRRRLNAMVTLLLLVIVLMGTLIINVFGAQIFQTKALLWFYRLRHLYSFLILNVLLALMFWLLPGRPLPFLSCLESGFFSSAAWILSSFGFSIYVNHFQSYEKVYGSLGLLLLASLWLQICICMLFYGVLLGKFIREKSYHPIGILKRFFSL